MQAVRSFSSTPRSSTPSPDIRVAIIGSGPAGFYAAAKLIEKHDGVVVDMYERLPVPFGLVRFGVAPDHPEVKNCEDRFMEVAESPRFNFIGNVRVGYDLPLRILKRHYDALLFSYGASEDRQLGLSGEDTAENNYSARAFVGWYNGLPEYRDLNPDLTSGEDAIVIGQGNVALDVARILLSDVDELRKTDITDYALETLASSKIRHVRVVGRRGPVQAAFTIKEVRELMQMPVLNKTSPSAIPSEVASLPRASKRLLQLLQKGQISTIAEGNLHPKSWSLDFLLSPKSLQFSDKQRKCLNSITFTRNQLSEPLSPNSSLLPPTPNSSSTMDLPCTTLFRSIGYKSSSLPGLASDLGIHFDVKRGIIPNDPDGRILSLSSSTTTTTSTSDQEPQSQPQPLPGLYTAGWVKRGPTGVIATTMLDAFVTAEAILHDISQGRPFLRSPPSSSSPSSTTSSFGSSSSSSSSSITTITTATGGGYQAVLSDAKSDPEVIGKGKELRPTTWDDYKKIDKAERERGREKGKEGGVREKFGRVEEMLAVLG